jgi:hypothetical protein
MEVVQKCWEVPVNANNKARVLHVKLARLDKALKRWSKERLALIKQESTDASSTVMHLDQEQDTRQLTDEEIQQRGCKGDDLGIGTSCNPKDQVVTMFTIDLDQGRRRQHKTVPPISLCEKKKELHPCSSPSWCNLHHSRVGTTQLLQRATGDNNARRVHTCLEQLTATTTWCSSAGQHGPRRRNPHGNNSNAGRKKNPGPDGYIGSFYKACWHTIKFDLVGAIHHLFDLRTDAWELLNSANVTLIAKKDEAETCMDYRPISLMYSVTKIIGKVLAIHLSSHLNQLVSPCQSTFIRGRRIQDNFQFIQGATRHFQHTKTPMLLLKLDIAKAFDNAREYMLEVMEQLGFGQR